MSGECEKCSEHTLDCNCTQSNPYVGSEKGRMYGVKLKHKFGAKRCEYDGLKFPSKLEGATYLRLKHNQEKGRILFFLRQVPFDLDHGRHYVDFCVFTQSGDVLFIESKGRDLGEGRNKRLSVEARLGIQIHVVKSANEVDKLFDV